MGSVREDAVVCSSVVGGDLVSEETGVVGGDLASEEMGEGDPSPPSSGPSARLAPSCRCEATSLRRVGVSVGVVWRGVAGSLCNTGEERLEAYGL